MAIAPPFTCARCRKTFKTRNKEEVRSLLRDPEAMPNLTLCDDCIKDFKLWWLEKLRN
jgi:hypothetical protein